MFSRKPFSHGRFSENLGQNYHNIGRNFRKNVLLKKWSLVHHYLIIAYLSAMAFESQSSLIIELTYFRWFISVKLTWIIVSDSIGGLDLYQTFARNIFWINLQNPKHLDLKTRFCPYY
jgi:hypothetical protein